MLEDSLKSTKFFCLIHRKKVKTHVALKESKSRIPSR